MMKRNDGYALAYVMVVLLVLAFVSLATMSLALIPAKNQAATQQRMQDKYAAQGLVEQVVAQLEHAVDANAVKAVLDAYPQDSSDPNQDVYCQYNSGTYTIVAKYGITTVTAEFTLMQITKTETTNETDANGNPISITSPVGHTVQYLSFKTETETEAAP